MSTQTQADVDAKELQARANTILTQLGGRRFVAMTGARNIIFPIFGALSGNAGL
jgi:hypothetical protein